MKRGMIQSVMLNAEAVIVLIFGVLVVSVFTFIGFPILNRNKRIDAVLGTLWKSAPIKGTRRLVLGLFLFLLVISLTLLVYSLWLHWIADLPRPR